MPYLQYEKTRRETEKQRATEELASLNARLQVQQPTIEAAKVRVQVAKTKLTEARAPIPALEKATAEADQKVSELNLEIRVHEERAPDTSDVHALVRWQKRLDELNGKLGEAETDAALAQARLNDGRTAVSQATAEVQNAERQLADATSASAEIQRAIAAAQARHAAAQGELALLNRWNEEISRDPLDRKTLEQVAAELSDRAAVLQDAHALTRVQHEIANETLSSLSTRRAQFTAALSRVNAELGAALEELRAARAALTEAIRRI